MANRIIIVLILQVSGGERHGRQNYQDAIAAGGRSEGAGKCP